MAARLCGQVAGRISQAVKLKALLILVEKRWLNIPYFLLNP